MIDLAAVITASIVCAAGVMSPGANFVAVTHRAVTASRAEVLALVLGVACVSALWASAAVFGLGILFSLFPWLFWSVKLLGAAYLVWFGIRLVRGSRLALPEKSMALTRSTFIRAFRDGIVTNLSNPGSSFSTRRCFRRPFPSAHRPLLWRPWFLWCPSSRPAGMAVWRCFFPASKQPPSIAKASR